MIEQKIEQDLKSAMLARNSLLVETLRGLKSVILYVKVANGSRDEAMSDEAVIALLSKEAKKRQESADLYVQGGDKDRADKELSEKKIIEAYLPAKMSIEDLEKLVDQTISTNTDANLGQVIGLVKSKSAGTADGGDIARLVKERLA